MNRPPSSRQPKKEKTFRIYSNPSCCTAGRIFHATAAEWYSIGVIHFSFN